jgi:hypothetical protein
VVLNVKTIPEDDTKEKETSVFWYNAGKRGNTKFKLRQIFSRVSLAVER